MPNPANTANNNQVAPTGTNLADVLVSMGVLDQNRAEQIKLAEVQYGSTQEEIIKKQNIVSNEALVKAKSTLYNIPYLDILNSPSSPEALSILPQEVATKFKVFPVNADKASKTLTLAMSDPLDLTAIEFVERKQALGLNLLRLKKIKLVKQLHLDIQHHFLKKLQKH